MALVSLAYTVERWPSARSRVLFVVCSRSLHLGWSFFLSAGASMFHKMVPHGCRRTHQTSKRLTFALEHRLKRVACVRARRLFVASTRCKAIEKVLSTVNH